MIDHIGEIVRDCEEIIAQGGQGVSIIFNKGCGWRGMGFGRGELLCEQKDGSRVYRFNVRKVLASLTDKSA